MDVLDTTDQLLGLKSLLPYANSKIIISKQFTYFIQNRQSDAKDLLLFCD
jgi:hypothetical protein